MSSKKMRKVMAFGTFDLLHPGHKSFLRQAKNHGDFLTVVVARDENVLDSKGKIPVWDEETRLSAVSQISSVDKAMLGSKSGPYTLIDIISEMPDVICLGYDQWPPEEKLESDLSLVGLHGIALRRLVSYKPHLYKSSILREQVEI